MKKISIPVNNDIVTGTLYYPEKLHDKNPAILFLHGWTSDESGYKPRAEALTQLGYICLAINLRGHGTSSGKLEDYSRKNHLDDALAAYDFIANQKEIDTENISIVGASYGGYLGALAAEKRTVNSLAMRAPAIYLNTEFDTPTARLIQDRESDFFKNFIPEEENSAIEGIRKTKQVLLIESEFDQIIPHKIIELYKKENPNTTHKIIKNADHQLSKEEWKKEFIDILVEWFTKK